MLHKWSKAIQLCSSVSFLQVDNLYCPAMDLSTPASMVCGTWYDSQLLQSVLGPECGEVAFVYAAYLLDM